MCSDSSRYPYKGNPDLVALGKAVPFDADAYREASNREIEARSARQMAEFEAMLNRYRPAFIALQRQRAARARNVELARQAREAEFQEWDCF